MLRVILHQPETAGNVGFIARLAENFAVDELIIVDPACDLNSDAAMQHASNAQDTLRTARTPATLDHAIEDLDVLIGTTGVVGDADNVLRNGVSARQLRDHVTPDARTGVLFGPEGTGLSNAVLDRCDVVAAIPADADYPVLNLSHAAAIVLYELFAAERDERPEEDVSSRAERAALENLFKGVMESFEWEENRQERTLRAFRNVLGRAYVTGREYQLLLGLFSEMNDATGDT